MHEFDAIFWTDTSGRMTQGDWTSVYTKARQSGVVQFMFTGRTVYPVTQPRMYQYLVTDEEKMKSLKQYTAAIMMFYKTEDVYWNVLHWVYMCSLTPQCIMPKGHRRSCPRRSDIKVSQCHRYDQSAVSIVLGNYFGFDTSRYVADLPTHVVTVQRKNKVPYNPLVCTINRKEKSRSR